MSVSIIAQQPPTDTAALVAVADARLTKALGRLWLAIDLGTTNEALKTRAAWEMKSLAEGLR